MIAQLNVVKELVARATKEYVDEGLMPESNITAVIDKTISDEDMCIQLRGSIIRTTAGDATKFYAVPAAGPVYETKTAAGPRLQVIDKWGQAAKHKRLVDFGRIESALLGVLAFPTTEGSQVASIMLGPNPATISPGPEGPITSVSIKAAGSVAITTIEAAADALKLTWQPWDGMPGGMAGVPTGGGFPVAADTASRKINEATLTEGGPMAKASLQTIGLLSDEGEVTAAEAGAFLAAAMGEPRAKDILAAGLAVADGNTGARAKAIGLGEETIKALIDLAAQINIGTARAVVAAAAPMRAINMHVGGEQLGTMLAAEAGRQALAARLAEAGSTRAADAGPLGQAAKATSKPGPGVAAAQAATEAADDNQLQATLISLGLDDSVLRTIATAQAAQAVRSQAVSSVLGFAALRPEGAAALSDWEVLRRVGEAIEHGGADVAQMTKELANTLGNTRPADENSIFGGADKAAVDAASADWQSLMAATEAKFTAKPKSWCEAAERVSAVLVAYRRTGRFHPSHTADRPGGAGSPAPAPGGEAATKDELVGAFKTLQAAKTGGADRGYYAAGGDLLTPLADIGLARSEAVATRGDNPLSEVRRLVSMPGQVGQAAAALIFSDGTATAPSPKGVVNSVIDGRAALRVWVVGEIEPVVGEGRLDEVHEKIGALADAIIAVRASNKDGKSDDTCIYALAVYLLGGSPPSDECATDADTAGAGTWGTRTGVQSQICIPTAMLHLARILAAVHGTAGGGNIDGAGLGASPRASSVDDGLGLTRLARAATGRLEPAAVEELFLDLFRRAQAKAARRRTRLGAEAIDWPACVTASYERKLEPLLHEQRAAGAAVREIARRSANSPKREREGETDTAQGGEGGQSKRAQKRAAAKEKEKEKDEKKTSGGGGGGGGGGGNGKPATQTQTANQQRAAGVLAQPPPGSVAKLAPDSITKLGCKATHNGASERLQELYVARNPQRRQREEQACPFAAIREGGEDAEVPACKDDAVAGASAQCDGWKATAVADRVPFLKSEIATVKAACVARLQKLFKD